VVNERTYQIRAQRDAGTRAGMAARYDGRGNDGKPIVIGTEIQPSTASLDDGGGGDRAESDATMPSFYGQPWLARNFGHSGPVALPAPDSRAVQPGLYVGDFVRNTRSLPALSLCSGPASTRTSSPPTPSVGTRDGDPREIEEQLKSVASLDEDRILRLFTNLVQATIRTNLWQIGQDGQPRPVISFKFEARRSRTCRPRPLYEIFVYSPRVEGIHLRFGKVARGGLRWSIGRRIFAPNPAVSRHSRSERRHRPGRSQRRFVPNACRALQSRCLDGGRH